MTAPPKAPPSPPRRPTAIRRGLLLGVVALALAGYWALPISGQVALVPEGWSDSTAWPRARLEPPNPSPGQSAVAVVTDLRPWTHVKLLVAGRPAAFQRYEENPRGYWSWYWTFTVPEAAGYELAFYRDCDTGCIERSRFTIGPALASDSDSNGIPTKLGLVFANPDRDWHGRNGWDVELTYALQAEAEYWGVDDLALRVQRAASAGLRVLVRVDYEQGQSLPPAGNHLALDAYLRYLRRLARDERLAGAYGYVIGSGYNTRGGNALAPDRPVTPEWYARVFNGYGADPANTHNAVEVIHAERPAARVMVGPVTPWTDDQNGTRRYRIDAPWLNYMNTLAAPDGFAVQAPGRPDAPELAPMAPADEPRTDLQRSAWNGAQAGFRVYRDWLDVINAYPHARGLPMYITSTNTFTPDIGVAPAENYPAGWLSTALDVVNREPQVLALCWFLDSFPLGDQWEHFSLTNPRGLLAEAAGEFDRLLNLGG